MAVDRAELQRMAQLVEFNRERMQTIEQQVRQLEAIRMEQIQAIEALRAIPEEGAEGAMIPLGSGLQIIANRLRQEFDELEKTTVETAQKFNENVEHLDPEDLTSSETETEAPAQQKTPRRKRKRGTELTLDD